MNLLGYLLDYLRTAWRKPPPSPPAPPSIVAAHPDWWHGGVPEDALAFSRVFEGFRAEPYLDTSGVWTIGYGSTRDADGRRVRQTTPSITREEADALTRRDLTTAANLARIAFPDGLPARWGAVVILMNNNLGDIRKWGPTLRQMLAQHRWQQAAEQMKEYRRSAGVPNKGLRRRRWAEAAFALGMDADAAHDAAWSRINSPDDWPPLPRAQGG